MFAGSRIGDLAGVTRRKLRAVISCQHAVKDNRVDSQLRPAEVVEVVANAWAERVFSRPGPQEPEEGLPGLDEENPIDRSMGKTCHSMGESRYPEL
jgi:hypothetical protein